MRGEFDQLDAKLHWLWPAIIVGMATLFVVLLVTTGLVWWLVRPDAVEPEVEEGWSLAENAGVMTPASQSARLASDAREGEAPAEIAAADTGTARQEPRLPQIGEAKPASLTPAPEEGNRGLESAPGAAPPKQAGQETNAAQRYALLDQARALAADAGDLRLALSVIGELGRGFQIDTQMLTAEVLKKLAKSVTGHCWWSLASCPE